MAMVGMIGSLLLRMVIRDRTYLAQRYRVLAVAPQLWNEETRSVDALKEALRSLVERGQREGSFRSDLPASWLATLASAALFAAVRARPQGELEGDDLAEIIGRTLHGGLLGDSNSRQALAEAQVPLWPFAQQINR